MEAPPAAGAAPPAVAKRKAPKAVPMVDLSALLSDMTAQQLARPPRQPAAPDAAVPVAAAPSPSQLDDIDGIFGGLAGGSTKSGKKARRDVPAVQPAQPQRDASSSPQPPPAAAAVAAGTLSVAGGGAGADDDDAGVATSMPAGSPHPTSGGGGSSGAGAGWSASLPVPGLLRAVLAGVPDSVLAVRLSRGVALDVAAGGGRPAAAAVAARTKRLPREYLHSCHGLKLEPEPGEGEGEGRGEGGGAAGGDGDAAAAAPAPPHRRCGLAPLGRGAALQLHAPGQRGDSTRAFGDQLTPADLATLHERWRAYARAMLAVHARSHTGGVRASGGGPGGANGAPTRVPAGIVLETLMAGGQGRGRIKEVASGGLDGDAGGDGGPGRPAPPPMAAGEAARLLTPAFVAQLDLRFSRLSVARCPRMPAAVGTDGYVVHAGGGHVKLAVVGGAPGAVGGGDAGVPPRPRMVRVPTTDAWFRLDWPLRGGGGGSGLPPAGALGDGGGGPRVVVEVSGAVLQASAQV
jgi:hypothetical protein